MEFDIEEAGKFKLFQKVPEKGKEAPKAKAAAAKGAAKGAAGGKNLPAFLKKIKDKK